MHREAWRKKVRRGEAMHRGFPYHVVKEVYRELVEVGEKYVRYFVVGLVPPTDKEPLRIVFGCLEEDKNAGPGGTKPRRFFNPVKIPVEDWGCKRMARIVSWLLATYVAMKSLVRQSSPGVMRKAEYERMKLMSLHIDQELFDKMRHMAGR